MSALSEITFAIPTYNRNDYLVKILDSLPDNANVVVSDNGGHVTQEIKDKYKNFLFVTPTETLEMYQNWNFCINQVKTKWFIIPSDDDLYYPEKLHALFDSTVAYANYGMLIFGHNVIDEHGEVVSSWKPEKLQEYKKPFGFNRFKYGVDARLPGIVFNTGLAKQHELFKQNYVYTAADSLLIQKCLLTADCVLIPDIIGAYRVWPQNFTTKLISTEGWLQKVDQWQDEIMAMAIPMFAKINANINSGRIKDEVYTNNLIAGLSNLSKQKFSTRYRFFQSVRFPHKASMKSQLRILKSLIIT